MKTIDTNDYSGYQVTGVGVLGSRFKKIFTHAVPAFGINLWRGSVWGIRKDNGKRQLLKRVWN